MANSARTRGDSLSERSHQHACPGRFAFTGDGIVESQDELRGLIAMVQDRIENPPAWYESSDLDELRELRTILLGTLADSESSNAA